MLPLLPAAALLALVCASTTSAAPWPTHAKHSTHSVRHIRRDFQLQTFHPGSIFQTFGEGIDHPLQLLASDDLENSATSFVQARLNRDPKTVAYHSGYAGDVSKHAYLKQVHEGVPFANAVSNVAFNSEDKIISFGSSFVTPSYIASSRPSFSLEDATALAEQALGGTFNGKPPTLEYLALDDNTAALTHVIQIQNDQAGVWKEAFVDAHSGKLLGVTDFVFEASYRYRVLPIKKQVATDGFETLTDPQDTVASPSGWHTEKSTTGNNAYAYKSKALGLKILGITQQPSSPSPGSSSPSIDSSSSSDYIYTQNPAQAPSAQANLDAARVNAFYIVNTMHDISYRYGFTEKAFNFQDDNFKKGGKGGDRIQVSVQDDAGTNNANFAAPPDGQHGQMRMYIWTFTNPMRDGSLENDIIVHENTHGISNRMTGGGTGRCLQTTEAGGMGEGWSDAFAEWTEQKSSAVKDYVLGQYVYNNPKGIRSHPYSTSMTTNPLTYASVAASDEVHNIGEIWANMLHNVYAALVAKNGFSDKAFTSPTTNPDAKAGNVMFMHDFMDGFALQPCNPTFIDARDAFLQADQNRYNGVNKCDIWKAFASRGLGANALAGKYVDNMDIPAKCK